MDQAEPSAHPRGAPSAAALLHALFDASPEAIAVLDEAGAIVGWNAAAATVFGWTSQEVAGRSFAELILAAADQPNFGTPPAHDGHVECSVLRRDGSVFPAALSITSAGQAGDRFEVIRVRDRTEAKDIERERDRALSAFRAFVENAPIPMTAQTKDGRIVLANRQSCEYYGRSIEEMRETNLADLAAHWPTLKTDIPGLVDRILETGDAMTVEAEMASALHGELRTVQLSAFPILDAAEGDEDVAMMGTIGVDVTESARTRRELERVAAELRVQRAMFRAFIDNAPVPMSAVTKDRIVFVNGTTAEYYGKTEEEVCAFDLPTLASYWPDFEGNLGLLAQRVMDTGAPQTGEGQLRSALHGELRTIRLSLFPVFEEVEGERRIAMIGSVANDVTDLETARRVAEQSATELRAQRALFSAFVDHAPVAMTASTPDGKFALVNRKTAEYYGRTPDEVAAMDQATWASYWPNFQEDVLKVGLRVLKTRQPQITEAKMFSEAHGELRTMRHSAFPVFEEVDGERRLILVGGVAMDITDIENARQETERAAAELRAQRALFRAFVDNAPMPMAAKRRDGTFIFANRRQADAHGLPVEAMPDVDVEQLRQLVPGFEEKIFQPGQRSIDTGETIITEAKMFNRTLGEMRNLQFTFFPIHEEVDGEDRITQGGMISYDVTEIRRAERAQQEVSARLTQFLDHAPMSVALADRDGKLLVVNQATAAHLGEAPEALVGKTFADLMRYWPPGTDTAENLVARLQSGKTVRFAARFTAPGADQASGAVTGPEGMGGQWDDDGWRILDFTFFPIRDSRGEVTEIGNFAIDVTQIRRAQDRLATQQTALHQSEKLAALGQLLAGVAHELNNPLAIVKGRAAILKEKLAGSPHEASVTKLGDAADRCARIVKTFLAMARQVGPQRDAVDVNETIRGALDMTASGLRNGQVAIETTLALDLPQIETDGDQLVQALINLIINAQHALEEHQGERRLGITTSLDRARERVVIEVADTGPGIPAELTRRVFEPFYTSKEVGKGTGLGLSVCKGMVEANGGELLLSETPGGGATFRIVLPLIAPALAEAAPQPEVAARQPRQLRALVVDDEPELAEILTESLGALGFACVVAGNGREALDAIAKGGFDAIFCDVRMPVMDGMQFYKQLETDRPDLLSRLAFVSGDLLHRDVASLTAEARCPVIEKPFDPDQIRATALTLIAGGRS